MSEVGDLLQQNAALEAALEDKDKSKDEIKGRERRETKHLGCAKIDLSYCSGPPKLPKKG